jgi:hypothetical protein
MFASTRQTAETLLRATQLQGKKIAIWDRHMSTMTSLQHDERRRRHRLLWRSGVTLVELMVTSTVTLMLVLAIGLLIDSGNRAWQHTYDCVHSAENEDAGAIGTTFGSIGRRANRTNYVLYRVNEGVFMPVTPDPTKDEEVLFGDAVEFRYWDVALDTSDSHGIMDTEVTATAYALFYLDGEQLKMDSGSYPPGGIPSGGGRRNTSGVTTRVLANNVSGEGDNGPFSHTVSGDTGQGCVRLHVTLTDPDSGETTHVMSAALMRNIWPR